MDRSRIAIARAAHHGVDRPEYLMRRWVVTVTVVIVLFAATAAWQALGHADKDATPRPTRSQVTAPPRSPGPQPAGRSLRGVIRPSGSPEFKAAFTGEQLNTNIWGTCYPWESQKGCTNFGNARSEAEWYLPSQDRVSGGLLHLVAQKMSTRGRAADGRTKVYSCRSGMITSDPGFRFEYGYVRIRAYVPSGAGLWSALWLAAANLKWPPEIDILEAWGGPNPNAGAFLHYSTATGRGRTRALISPASQAFGWHTFELSWTRNQLTWLMDGRVILETHSDIPHQRMYLIANLAESTSRAEPAVKPGECNGSLLIKSIEVWKA